MFGLRLKILWRVKAGDAEVRDKLEQELNQAERKREVQKL